MSDIFPNVIIENNLFGKEVTDKKGNVRFIASGRAVWVTAVLVEIETGNEWLELEFITDINTGSKKKANIPRAWINMKFLTNLCELGIDAQTYNQNTLFKLIQNQETMLNKTFCHVGVGWGHVQHKGKEVTIFKSNEILGDIVSSYVGDRKIGAHGSYNKWHEIISTQVMGSQPLELAVVVGLSATLIGYLNLFEDTETLLVHLCGDSSTGKTTAARLAISVAGKPTFVGATLMSTFQATKNAITKMVANNTGLPQVFDELSMFISSLADLIYTLSSGKERGRLNKDSQMRKSENWATTIITTGEKNILNGAKQNAGLSVRVLVFDSINWTKDAQQAELITKTIEQNYGFASMKFAKHLMDSDILSVREKIEQWRHKYLEATTVHDQFTDRVSQKYAILLATASIAKKALDLKFNVSKLLKFFVECEAQTDNERDLGLKAYMMFLEYVETNPSAFGVKNGSTWSDVTGYQNWGVIENLKNDEKLPNGKICTRYIVIAESKFNDFCIANGFEDSRIVLKNWKAKCILKAEKDRLVSERKISSTGNNVKCYIVRVFNDHIEEPPPVKYTVTDEKTGKVTHFPKVLDES